VLLLLHVVVCAVVIDTGVVVVVCVGVCDVDDGGGGAGVGVCGSGIRVVVVVDVVDCVVMCCGSVVDVGGCIYAGVFVAVVVVGVRCIVVVTVRGVVVDVAVCYVGVSVVGGAHDVGGVADVGSVAFSIVDIVVDDSVDVVVVVDVSGVWYCLCCCWCC